MPVLGPLRVVVAIFSYDGGLYFGVTGDADSAPDVDVLTTGVERGMSDLLTLVEPPPQRPKSRSSKPKPRTRNRSGELAHKPPPG